MASALSVNLTLRETRALLELARAGSFALNFNAPGQADEIIAMLDIGAHDLAAKQSEARLRRMERNKRPNHRPMMNFDVEGFTISAELGDWIDISTAPDYFVWSVLSDHEGKQGEVRRNAWRVFILNPDRHESPMILAQGCTTTDQETAVALLASKLVGNILRQRQAA